MVDNRYKIKIDELKKKGAQRMIGISGSLIWSKTLMELIFGGFRAQVDQVHLEKVFKIAYNSTFRMNNFNATPDQVPASLLCYLWNRNSLRSSRINY